MSNIITKFSQIKTDRITYNKADITYDANIYKLLLLSH